MTPDTSFYYYAAYVIAAGVVGGYVASLWWRARSVRK